MTHLALPLTFASIALLGLIQAGFGYALVLRFRRRSRTLSRPGPALSVLKPLHGAEPLLEEALASLLAQDYDPFQVVLGVQDPRDPALAVVARLRARFPDADLAVVIDPTRHGRNPKVANLINMLPAARHDLLVIADSDVHAPAGYLADLARRAGRPGVGLVTTLYTGLPGGASLAGRLGATGITHGFLPGALMARALGRRDCLGATMAIRRAVLERAGGFAALVHHLADDNVLGERVAALGLLVTLAKTVPATTVPESRLADLFRHELRWARTIAAIVPVRFALSIVQYPLLWGGLAVAMSGFEEWAVAVFLAVWAVRALIARGIDHALGLATAAPIWLLPLRDLLSAAVVVASYLGDEVTWRGHALPSMPLGTKPP